jgi:haloacetate dehalogenase
MFEGFTHERCRTGEAEIDLVRGGAGPPLLVLRGYPQNKAMWHKVAPGLAAHFTAIAPDRRGYGDSSHPPDGEDHRAYSKQAMAADQVEVVERLGFPSFFVARRMSDEDLDAVIECARDRAGTLGDEATRAARPQGRS